MFKVSLFHLELGTLNLERGRLTINALTRVYVTQDPCPRTRVWIKVL
jgi:hypothetical protein